MAMPPIMRTRYIIRKPCLHEISSRRRVADFSDVRILNPTIRARQMSCMLLIEGILAGESGLREDLLDFRPPDPRTCLNKWSQLPWEDFSQAL